MNGTPIDLDVILQFQSFLKPQFLEVWLADNWHIYEQFENQTLELIRKGWVHFSSRTIVEEIRHYTRSREKGACSFKINDHMAPDMARLFTIRYPHYAQFWEYRRPDWRAFIAEVNKLKQQEQNAK